MASAARVHAAERGHDATGLPLFAFGGAGPVHAFGVGAALGTTTVIVPAAAGVMSSVGVLAAPLATDAVRSRVEPVDDETLARMEPLFAELEAEGAAILSPPAQRDHARALDRHALRRPGLRGHRPGRRPARTSRPRSRRPTCARTAARARTSPIEAISWRVLTRGPDPDLRLDRRARPATATRRRARATCASTTRYVPTPIYDRYRMGPGTQIEGPAIVEERESTTVVGPGATARVAEDGSLIIEVTA